MRPTVTFLAAGLAFAIALPALAAPAPDGPKDERIVFTTLDLAGKKVRIGIMNADGTKRTILSPDDAMELDPVLSPDGRRIAFVVFNKGAMTTEVWVMGTDGKDRKKIADGAAKTFLLAPVWSPNGKQIMYSKVSGIDGGAGPDSDMIAMDPDGKNSKSIGKGMMPVWSPDGKKVLYSALDPASKEHEPHLHVMDADGKNDKELAKGIGLMGVWSPDGKRIAYIGADAAGPKKEPQIYVGNADGSDFKRLTTSNEAELPVRWSADGKRLYFNRLDIKGGPPKKVPLFIIDADGKNEKELSKGDSSDMIGGAGLFLIFMTEVAPKP